MVFSFRLLPPSHFMEKCQTVVTPSARKTVAEWMLGVVHEEETPLEVFFLAMNVMDRVLSGTEMALNNMQLLGAVCLLVASKFRGPCGVPVKNLIEYTGSSITSVVVKASSFLISKVWCLKSCYSP